MRDQGQLPVLGADAGHDSGSLPATGEFCVGAGHVLGSVNLGGVWKGRIEVRMAEGLAYQATAAMMMQPLETVAEADALDATKEIANMIAGTIKSSLPRPCTMTVPESAVEAEGFCGPPQQRTRWSWSSITPAAT